MLLLPIVVQSTQVTSTQGGFIGLDLHVRHLAVLLGLFDADVSYSGNSIIESLSGVQYLN